MPLRADGPVMPCVLIVSCAEQYQCNGDDRLLVSELNTRGLPAATVAWDDQRVDWQTASVAVIRSVWDYHLKTPAFLAWLKRTARTTRIFNPPQQIRWNAHKSYLREFAAAGLPTVETIWLEQGTQFDRGLFTALPWRELVIKPTISASAWRTRMLNTNQSAAASSHLRKLLVHGDVMIQPRLKRLKHDGELSLMYIDGRFTHAVQRPSLLHKTTNKHVSIARPSRNTRALAERYLQFVTPTPLYARVDLVRSNTNALVLLELELIEPDLYLRTSNNALQALAKAIAQRV